MLNNPVLPYKLGDYNELKVIKQLDFGVYLEAGEEEILLPRKYIPEGLQIGDYINIFLYLDSEDRIIATTERPIAKINEIAALRVVDTNQYGVFMDWGLEKDLFVPFSEQHKKMFTGRNYLVKILVDEKTDRIYGSGKLEKTLQPVNNQLKEDDKVELIIWEFTDLGVKVIINELYEGILYHNEIFKSLFVGDRVSGYIKKIREDGKIDASIRQKGMAEIEEVKFNIIKILKSHKGFIPLNDESSPETIKEVLQISKKTFKKAIGGLMKENSIQLLPNGIQLVEEI